MHYYEIRVQGKLDPHWAQWFDDMHMEHYSNGETILSGNVRDQPALFRLLLQIHHLKMTLLSVNRSIPNGLLIASESDQESISSSSVHNA